MSPVAPGHIRHSRESPAPPNPDEGNWSRSTPLRLATKREAQWRSFSILAAVKLDDFRSICSTREKEGRRVIETENERSHLLVQRSWPTVPNAFLIFHSSAFGSARLSDLSTSASIHLHCCRFFAFFLLSLRFKAPSLVLTVGKCTSSWILRVPQYFYTTRVVRLRILRKKFIRRQ